MAESKQGIRLSDFYRDKIKDSVHQAFGDDARVLLFGSRTRLEAKGGDIDLLVESELKDEDAFRAKLQLLAKLYAALGEQKIDIITTNFEVADERLIVANAKREGIAL